MADRRSMPKPLKPKIAKKSDPSSIDALVTAATSGKASAGQYAALSAIGVAVLAIAGGSYYMLRSQVRFLSPSDTAVLKEVFYSGEPWLIECSKKAKASPVVTDAEGLMPGIKIGVLDCSAVLPSGKTTYERFKLKEPSYGPVIMAAANSERPQIALRNVLSTGTALAEWSKAATKEKVFSPATTAQFDSQCLRKTWCAVVISAGGRLMDAERAALATLAAAERKLRIVRVNSRGPHKACPLLRLPSSCNQGLSSCNLSLSY